MTESPNDVLSARMYVDMPYRDAGVAQVYATLAVEEQLRRIADLMEA